MYTTVEPITLASSPSAGKIALLVHQSLAGVAPPYLTDDFLLLSISTHRDQVRTTLELSSSHKLTTNL